jgi:predicted GIY-YIG superfamily endonuclease
MTIPAMELGDETPTALYRLYNSKGKLLYVGITGNIKTRFATHAESKPWWPEVSRRTVEWHLTRDSAAEAEVKAIKRERPLYNIRDARSPHRELSAKVTGKSVFDLVMLEMPPTSLRLALLELIGIPTGEALSVLGVGPTHCSRVIGGRKKPPSKTRRAA